MYGVRCLTVDRVTCASCSGWSPRSIESADYAPLEALSAAFKRLSCGRGRSHRESSRWWDLFEFMVSITKSLPLGDCRRAHPVPRPSILSIRRRADRSNHADRSGTTLYRGRHVGMLGAHSARRKSGAAGSAQVRVRHLPMLAGG
jgi:hypothetical protein